MSAQTQHVRLWTKTILALLLSAMLLTFLFLNMNAVVEPRVHLIFFTYERPGLLLVLLLAMISGAALWVVLRAVPRAIRHLRASRAASEMSGMQRELSELKAGMSGGPAAPLAR